MWFAVHNNQGDRVALIKHAEDAAAFVAIQGDGATVRHNGRVVWSEGSETESAGESYDGAATIMHKRARAGVSRFRLCATCARSLRARFTRETPSPVQRASSAAISGARARCLSCGSRRIRTRDSGDKIAQFKYAEDSAAFVAVRAPEGK